MYFVCIWITKQIVNKKREVIYYFFNTIWLLRTGILLFLSKIKKKFNLKPPGRIELPTPGLQDQCSNHWAMEA